ncbi:MAG: 16S rRNA (cytidine(1402)-2'-O)-methyltransferase [Arenicellales bacterium]
MNKPDQNPDQTGCLYIVATPIGNLKDISYRAVEVLSKADLILVEDTRNAAKLLQHYGIKQPLKAVHEHNEDKVAAGLIALIKQGQHIALISDAGTPLVSDPGFRMVQQAQVAGVQTVAVPGACAAIAALSIAGLPTDRFVFEGFLPAKQAAREQRIQALMDEPRTLVFYEAKHRILAFLGSLQKLMGGARRASVAREITKKFESLYHGSLDEVIEQISADALAQKGEFVVMVQGAEQSVDGVSLDHVLKPLLAALSVSKASKVAAEITGIKKNICYQRALEMHEGDV